MLSRFMTAALLWVCVLWSLPVFAAAGDLRGELEALAAQGGFSIEGLARLGPEPAGLAEGTPVERLKALLQDYNYLVVQSRPGLIERVLITSRKAADGAKSADRAYVETTRLGTHHQVQATLAGPNAVARTVPLLVDTGASTIVLPESMIEELGFAPEALQNGVSQTASGTVPVKIGVLRSVRVGAVSAGDVQVAFIADRRLNGTLLLGMSFLNRFRMTIDDAGNELILFTK